MSQLSVRSSANQLSYHSWQVIWGKSQPTVWSFETSASQVSSHFRKVQVNCQVMSNSSVMSLRDKSESRVKSFEVSLSQISSHLRHILFKHNVIRHKSESNFKSFETNTSHESSHLTFKQFETYRRRVKSFETSPSVSSLGQCQIWIVCVFKLCSNTSLSHDDSPFFYIADKSFHCTGLIIKY